MSKYDTEQFDPAPVPELVCCICHCVFLDPVQTPCAHVFCRICIETWLDSHQSCPTCRRQGIKKADLEETVPIIRSMIQSLTMRCDNKENGCTELMKLEQYETHIKDCPFALLQCKFKKCGEKILRMNLSDHENQSCPHREKQCEADCGLMIPLREIASHSCLEALKRALSERKEELEKMKQYTQELLEQKNSLGQQRVQLERQLNEARDRLEMVRAVDSTSSEWSIEESVDDSDFEEVNIFQMDDENDIQIPENGRIRTRSQTQRTEATANAPAEDLHPDSRNRSEAEIHQTDDSRSEHSGDESTSSSSSASSSASSTSSVNSSQSRPQSNNSENLQGQAEVPALPCSDSDTSDTLYSYGRSPKLNENDVLSDTSMASVGLHSHSNSSSSSSLSPRKPTRVLSTSESDSDSNQSDSSNDSKASDGTDSEVTEVKLSSGSSSDTLLYALPSDQGENDDSEIDLIQEEEINYEKTLTGISNQKEEQLSKRKHIAMDKGTSGELQDCDKISNSKMLSKNQEKDRKHKQTGAKASCSSVREINSSGVMSSFEIQDGSSKQARKRKRVSDKVASGWRKQKLPEELQSSDSEDENDFTIIDKTVPRQRKCKRNDKTLKRTKSDMDCEKEEKMVKNSRLTATCKSKSTDSTNSKVAKRKRSCSPNSNSTNIPLVLIHKETEKDSNNKVEYKLNRLFGKINEGASTSSSILFEETSISKAKNPQCLSTVKDEKFGRQKHSSSAQNVKSSNKKQQNTTGQIDSQFKDCETKSKNKNPVSENAATNSSEGSESSTLPRDSTNGGRSNQNRPKAWISPEGLKVPPSCLEMLENFTAADESDSDDSSWREDDPENSDSEFSSISDVVTEEDTDYEVKIPLSAGQLLAQIDGDSDDSDDSWKP
ncbi:dentin sialophosphoprotein [Lingula anatina]|uniref:Dentin sialophosphoprotein n=1 Tax=Lingula anatina TaxID=7574 RepID=A0A1S3HY28_LINAN|nr:dentin sialophosphoprotein [Lingula anatina]XP_013389978.1 dentin sialophosphoprotein [Lingula anatina]XP_013389979.1 dentin sialophosphoprotein [Lingula anatina]XP_013389980.1 dentin sialophosphoprotein [Lingula anatina]|eukprot:XP_013389977.1 dentin sialophosphoprotein [Lingula anatina]